LSVPEIASFDKLTVSPSLVKLLNDGPTSLTVRALPLTSPINWRNIRQDASNEEKRDVPSHSSRFLFFFDGISPNGFLWAGTAFQKRISHHPKADRDFRNV
jgi:hypothetical protein